MNVLVAGGTGFIGTVLCRELAGRGHDVTAMARDPGDAALPAGVDVRSGDVTDPDAVEAAVEGQDAVVNLVALSPLYKPKGGEQRHLEVHLGGTENLVAAAEAEGVDRFVQQSALRADPDAEVTYLRAKGLAEEAVRESDLDWVLTRPSIVFGDGCEIVSFTKLVTTPYVSGFPGGGRHATFQLIWVEDLAPVLADCVDDDRHAGETYELGGPEQQTLAEITRLIYRAEGKPLTIVPIPMTLAKVGFALADPVPLVPMGAEQYHGLTLDNTVERNDVEAFGVDPGELRTFADWLGIEGGEAEPAAAPA